VKWREGENVCVHVRVRIPSVMHMCALKCRTHTHTRARALRPPDVALHMKAMSLNTSRHRRFLPTGVDLLVSST
jgi:hypothetical protein